MNKQIIKSFIYWCSYNFKRNHHSKIIYYHDVGKKFTDMGTDLDLIKKHFEIVRNCGYRFVDEIMNHDDEIMVCFDDGWAGIYDSRQFFIEQDIHPTIFIAVDLIGKPGYLTLEQIREMQELGFIFEGHTWSHKDLTTFDDKDLWHEVKDSKNKLSLLLGKEVTAICYPKGRFSDKIYEACLEAGYNKQYSSISGAYFDQFERKKIICRMLVQFATPRNFKYILNSTSAIMKFRSIKLQYVKSHA